MLNFKFLNEKKYLLIPIIMFFLWSLLSHIKDNFSIIAVDFLAFYDSARYIFINPELVYTNVVSPRYRYLPSFATLFSILTIFPYEIAFFIWYFCLLFFGILSIITFNKILILKNVESKSVRFLFLLVISNGLKIMQTFDILQTKILGLYLLLLFIMRQIKYSQSSQEFSKNSYKFYVIQFSILSFVLGMMPFFIFIIPIYLFHNISYKEILNLNQIKKYFIFICVFLIQNFMFFVSPVLIFGFLSGTTNAFRTVYPIYSIEEIVSKQRFYPIISLECFIYAFGITHVNFSLLFGFSIGSMIILTGILLFKKKMSIENKIGYFVLFSLFFNMYPRPNTMVIFVPLIAILFIGKIKMREKGIKNIKANFIFLIGIFCVWMLYLMPPIYLIYEVFPFLMDIPISYPILLMRWTFLYIIIATSLFYLKSEKLLLEKND